MTLEIAILSLLIFAIALLYSSVGHAGASGYLAAMALMGLSPSVMRPTALMLNILVATIATCKFIRVGAFSWSLFWPLALTSIPCAAIGGLISLPGFVYKPLVGAVLIYSSWHSFHRANQSRTQSLKQASPPFLLMAGACLGLLSGLTGVGGGIFLSPLLLFFRWAEPRVISGTAATFILVNSISGLLAVASKTAALPDGLLYWAVAVVIGGWIGSELGSRRLGNPMILKLLALVLLIAGVKLVLMV